MGYGFGGGGQVLTIISERTQSRLTPELQEQFQAEKEYWMDGGTPEDQAGLRAFDKIAETKEGEKIIEEVTKEVVQEEALKEVKPKNEAERVAWEHRAKQQEIKTRIAELEAQRARLIKEGRVAEAARVSDEIKALKAGVVPVEITAKTVTGEQQIGRAHV